MQVTVTRKAVKQIKKLSRADQIAVLSKIKRIPDLYMVKHVTLLRGYSNVFRIRAGDVRIVVLKDKQVFTVVAVAHRREVYKLLKRMV